MKTLLKLFICISLTLVFTSCEKYLNVSDELAEEMDMEKIFSNPANVRKFHRNIYTGIPNTADYARGLTGLNLPWPQMSDEIDKTSDGTDDNTFLYNAGSTTLGRWSLYQQIRQANVFLENVKEIPNKGDADFLAQQEVNELKAQARFLRAYYHFLLFELYGPVPVMNTIADPSQKDIDYARNSVDEVVDFIDKELIECIADLKDPNLTDQQNLAVPTKGTARALRTVVLAYAASPLYNGGYQEALNLSNKDGKKLFPAYSKEKWNRALTAAKEFIDYANSGVYELYKVYDAGKYNPDRSLYELFMTYNKETIFVRSDVSWGSVPRAGVDGFSVPRGARGGGTTTGYLSVLQELVDDFFMIDGKSIEESPKYVEEGFSKAGDDPSGRTKVGTYNMYVNREPRFYQTVFYNTRNWHVGNEVITFQKGGNSDNSLTKIYPKAGTILYKRLSKKVYDQGSNPKSEYRPGIIYRLADLYLLYAEILNEVDPSHPDIIEYIDRVRSRAGIPLLKDINPGISGQQEKLREAIRRERRVELATEGQRYFDVRRWMLAETEGYKQGGQVFGMNMEAPTLSGFYKRVPIETRLFSKAMYLYPIPLTEIQKSRLLVQNPGY
ncbi:RagB/SusD family nutrient uptake outer membrane protein [Sphingobacterium spiritivorum]|uniref:RagB/SusD family nutrient uptake outer membrane protein n=1 Tax=Sphingobacterium spiritivorum TaxID=258 RepID=UPI003DA2EC43